MHCFIMKSSLNTPVKNKFELHLMALDVTINVSIMDLELLTVSLIFQDSLNQLKQIVFSYSQTSR